MYMSMSITVYMHDDLDIDTEILSSLKTNSAWPLPFSLAHTTRSHPSCATERQQCSRVRPSMLGAIVAAKSLVKGVGVARELLL